MVQKNDDYNDLENGEAHKDTMIRITGLSRKKDRNGNTYLIGANNALTQFLVLPNTGKHLASQPDYHLFMRTNPKAEYFDLSKSNNINI